MHKIIHANDLLVHRLPLWMSESLKYSTCLNKFEWNQIRSLEPKLFPIVNSIFCSVCRQFESAISYIELETYGNYTMAFVASSLIIFDGNSSKIVSLFFVFIWQALSPCFIRVSVRVMANHVWQSMVAVSPSTFHMIATLRAFANHNTNHLQTLTRHNYCTNV